MAKGGNFEREIAKRLSLWWSEGKRDDIFYRSHASGGRFTVRRKHNKDTEMQGGDITASDPSGVPLIKNWSIEIKTGYGKKTDTGVSRWDTLDFLDSRQSKPVLEKMWDQCCRDADLTQRMPILIFRRNNREPCIMFWSYYFNHLVDHFGYCIANRISFRISKGRLFVILPLKSFFNWIPDIRNALCSKISRSKTSNPIKKRVSISRKG